MELFVKRNRRWRVCRRLAAFFISFHCRAIVYALLTDSILIYWVSGLRTGLHILVNFKNVMISFLWSPYKKRHKFGNEEETAIYFNPSGTGRETTVMQGIAVM